MTPGGARAEHPATRASGPGLVTAPALSAADAPLAVLSYRLGAADLAAWLARSRPGRRALRMRLFSGLLVGLMGLQWLSARPGLPGSGAAGRLAGLGLLALVLVLPVLLSVASLRHSQRAEARAELPAPQPVTLTQWPDRIEEARQGKLVTIRPQRLLQLTVTRGHIFGETETARLILPRTAFADRAAMQAFARWLAERRQA